MGYAPAAAEQPVTVSRRNAAIGAGAVLLLLVGAFFAGRFAAPLKVETIDTVSVKFQDRIVEKVVEKVVEKTTKGEVQYIDRVTTKAGEIRERIVIKTVEVARATTDRAAERTEDKAVASSEEHRQTVTSRPDWRVGLVVGAQWPKPLLPIYGPLILGAYGERRIIGGFSLGLWLNTGGAAGVSASMEF